VDVERRTGDQLASILDQIEADLETTGSPPRSVKVTVDLRWFEHRALRALCLWYAEQLDVPRVAAAEVFRHCCRWPLPRSALPLNSAAHWPRPEEAGDGRRSSELTRAAPIW
jgi:hypothetical protein